MTEPLETEIEYTRSLLSQCKKESRAYQCLTNLIKELEQEKKMPNMPN